VTETEEVAPEQVDIPSPESTESPEFTEEFQDDQPDSKPEPPEKPVKIKNRPFPKPPRGQGRYGNVAPAKFFEYWRGLSKACQECADRCIVYIYREYPKMNYLLALSPEEQELVIRKKRKEPQKNIAKLIEPFESGDWRDEMLRRYGEGDYKLLLNDTGMKQVGAAAASRNQNILKTFVELRDDSHPPVIEDIRCVDPDDPINRSYLERAKREGLLNHPAEETKEEDDMAGAGAEVIKDLSGKIIEMAGKQQQQVPPAPPAKETPSDAAALAAIDLMGKAFDSIQQNAAKQNDPEEYVKKVVEIANLIKPAQTNNGVDAIVTLLTKQLEVSETRHAREMEASEKRHDRDLQMMRDHHREAMAQIEERFKLLNVTPTSVTATAEGKQQSEFQVLDKLVNLKEKMDSLMGGGSDGVPGWAPLALQGLKIVGDLGANIMHNAAVARTGQGAALPPPATSVDPEAEQEQAEANVHAQYARMIHPDLKDALQKKMSGNEFAARLVLKAGNSQLYDTVCADGKDGLIRFLQSAPEVWGTFTSFGAGNQNQIFIDQFLDRDAVMKTIEILTAPRPQPRRGPVVNVEPIA